MSGVCGHWGGVMGEQEQVYSDGLAQGRGGAYPPSITATDAAD